MYTKKIIIAILCVLILIVGLSVVLKNKNVPQNAVLLGQKNTTQVLSPECEGVKKSGLSDGFPHTDTRSIKTGSNITITLSCDFLNLDITGAVEQKINSQIWNNDPKAEREELIDGAFGAQFVAEPNMIPEEAIDLRDFNFDGYNDLVLLQTNGNGSVQVDTYKIFLYSPTEKKFIYSSEFSNIENINITEDGKAIYSNMAQGFGTYITTFYSVVKNSLKKEKVVSCLAEKEDTDGLATSVRYKVVVYDSKGIASVQKNIVQDADAKDSCVYPWR